MLKNKQACRIVGTNFLLLSGWKPTQSWTDKVKDPRTVMQRSNGKKDDQDFSPLAAQRTHIEGRREYEENNFNLLYIYLFFSTTNVGFVDLNLRPSRCHLERIQNFLSFWRSDSSFSFHLIDWLPPPHVTLFMPILEVLQKDSSPLTKIPLPIYNITQKAPDGVLQAPASTKILSSAISKMNWGLHIPTNIPHPNISPYPQGGR